jgi:hypothetical protein
VGGIRYTYKTTESSNLANYVGVRCHAIELGNTPIILGKARLFNNIKVWVGRFNEKLSSTDTF